MKQTLSLLALSCALFACSDPQSPSQGSGGQSNAAGAAGSGGIPSGSGGSHAFGGSASGPTGGAAASSNRGGSTATGGNSGTAGSASTCACPASAPVGGGLCDSGCDGHVCVYEDCTGQGFVQSSCASGTWFDLQQTCGDTPCGAPGMSAEMTCAPGFVCVYVASEQPSLKCRPHFCGTGPITCACLQGSCTGTCSSYGSKWFTCGASQ